MPYQISAYLFLKALYNEHLLLKTDIGRMDFERIKEFAAIKEPDGILDLIVTFLRGKKLIHVSYKGSNLEPKTYYISDYGIKCINSFECAKVFNDANTILSEILHNGEATKNASISSHESVSEKECHAFFSKC